MRSAALILEQAIAPCGAVHHREVCMAYFPWSTVSLSACCSRIETSTYLSLELDGSVLKFIVGLWIVQSNDDRSSSAQQIDDKQCKLAWLSITWTIYRVTFNVHEIYYCIPRFMNYKTMGFGFNRKYTTTIAVSASFFDSAHGWCDCRLCSQGPLLRTFCDDVSDLAVILRTFPPCKPYVMAAVLQSLLWMTAIFQIPFHYFKVAA